MIQLFKENIVVNYSDYESICKGECFFRELLEVDNNEIVEMYFKRNHQYHFNYAKEYINRILLGLYSSSIDNFMLYYSKT